MKIKYYKIRNFHGKSSKYINLVLHKGYKVKNRIIIIYKMWIMMISCKIFNDSIFFEL